MVCCSSSRVRGAAGRSVEQGVDAHRAAVELGHGVEQRFPEVLHRGAVAEDLQVLQIVREALANIVRHSHARTARIDLRLARSEPRVTVEDDGVGLQACGETGHFGLSIMRERALAIGAGLSVKTIPPRGTRVALRLPGVARDPEEKADAQRHLAADR